MATPIPDSAGIGLRHPHYVDVLEQKPPIAWLEVHPENYFGTGGTPLYYLEKCREHYPLSLHGVGMSLGSVDPLSQQHLSQLKSLIDRFEPTLVSEHLSWGSIDGQYFNDLLPLPYTEESLRHFCTRVEQAQDILQRQILIENPSSYLSFADSTIPEWEFINEIALRSGCGLLLDINNIFVSAANLGFDATNYINQISGEFVQEIHLAGFATNHYEEGDILIDNHGAPVAEAVWALFRRAIERMGNKPTLIEWDSDLPSLDVLADQAQLAQNCLDNNCAIAA